MKEHKGITHTQKEKKRKRKDTHTMPTKKGFSLKEGSLIEPNKT